MIWYQKQILLGTRTTYVVLRDPERATAETKELWERLPHTDPESPAVPPWAAFPPPLSNVSS